MHAPIARALRAVALLVIAMAAIAACAGNAGATAAPSSTPTVPMTDAPPSASAPDMSPPAALVTGLAGTSWMIVGYAGPTGVATAMIPRSTVSLTLGADGNAGGNGGCNRYGGSYTTDPASGTLAFGPLMQTEMACPPQSTMDQESAYLAALARTSRYRMSGANLQLVDSAGTVVVEAEPAPTE